jgi:hypothetical protein
MKDSINLYETARQHGKTEYKVSQIFHMVQHEFERGALSYHYVTLGIEPSLWFNERVVSYFKRMGFDIEIRTSEPSHLGCFSSIVNEIRFIKRCECGK